MLQFRIRSLFVLLLVVLVVNPLLRLIKPRWALTRAQLAIILGTLLVASVLPGQGFSMLPYSLAGTCVRVSTEKQLADAYSKADLPAGMFPDKLGYEPDTPIDVGVPRFIAWYKSHLDLIGQIRAAQGAG